MIDFKTARIGLLVSMSLLLSACGTKLQAPDNSSAPSTSSSPVIFNPPPGSPQIPQGFAELPIIPSATNTGVPVGTLLRASAGFTVTTPGTVVDGLNITGAIHINADNVTLKRSKITVASTFVVVIDNGVRGVIVEDCEINGVGSDNDNSMGIQGPGAFLRNNIHNVQAGIVPGSGTLIQDNYIHDLMAPATPGYNGVQIDGGVYNVSIHHNWIINPSTQEGAVNINNFFGPVSNVTVTNNVLGGGAHTVIVDAQFSTSPIGSISFTGNSLIKGAVGYKFFNLYTPVFSGNVDNTTKALVP